MKIRSYIAELRRADPGGRFIVEVDTADSLDFVYVKRIFVCFSSLEEGFLRGCRPMFGLDRCFMKGEVLGMILSDVGKDGNNQMYPIAWAVVEGENKNSWAWFLRTLQEELALSDGNGWSVISDQQKGLVDAIGTILPFAKHRKCARHVFANWRVKNNTDKMREYFWYAVYSSNEVTFNSNLKLLEELERTNEDRKTPFTDFFHRFHEV